MDNVNPNLFNETEEIDLSASDPKDTSFSELKTLTREFSRLTAEKTQLEEDLALTKMALASIQDAIITLFENIGGGMKSVRNELGLFSMLKTTTVSIDQEKYDEAVRWCEMQGGSRLFKKSAHWKALSSFVQNQIKESGEAPPDCFKVTEIKSIRFTEKKKS